MKLAVFNGSPRGKNSNSAVIAGEFLRGYRAAEGADVPVSFISKRTAITENLEIFSEAESAVFIFPLYTDCMPGIVLEFLEAVAEKKFSGKKRLGFIIHSGFPESVHSEALERYLAKFTKRAGFEYIGTIIKGGSEGVRLMPPQMNRKLFGYLNELGRSFALSGEFSSDIKTILSRPRRMSSWTLFWYRALIKTGFTNFYWNSNLKKNNAFKDSFARPHMQQPIY